MARPTVLRAGDSGEAVRELQQRLYAAGHELVFDGSFGPATEAAVRAFQARRALHTDGLCGPETWGALVESSYHLGDRLLYLRRPMVRGDDVGELQQRLNALGFDAGREDAILGPATERALRAFQRDAGVASDGVCGPATLGALGRLDSLAAGSVAAVRERDALARDPRRFSDRRCYLAADPSLDVLARDVARSLRAAGAHVALDPSGSDPGVLAEEANRFGADLCLVLGPGAEAGARCAYFASARFRSEAGFALASRLTAALRSELARVDAPVGRTYRMLRETRMAAVVVELFARDDPAELAGILGRSRALAGAIATGARLGVEAPIDVTG